MKPSSGHNKWVALATTVAVVLSTGVLSACTSTTTTNPSDIASDVNVVGGEMTAKDIAALKTIKFEDATGEGAKPVISIPEDLTLSAAAGAVLIEGTGDPIQEGDQLTMNVSQFTIPGNKLLYSTWDTGDPDRTARYSATTFNEQLYALLAGKKVGTVFAFATPNQDPAAAASSESPASSPTGSPEFALVIAKVEAVEVIPDRATGTPVTLPKGLPTVKLAEDGTPAVTIPKGFKPSKKLVSEYTIEGDGPVVPEGATITAQYVGYLTDGKIFDSSWDRGIRATFSLGQVVKGWAEGLAGKKVGSQVLLIVPPEFGYGDQAQGEDIPANSTLIFVVDILAAN